MGKRQLLTLILRNKKTQKQHCDPEVPAEVPSGLIVKEQESH